MLYIQFNYFQCVQEYKAKLFCINCAGYDWIKYFSNIIALDHIYFRINYECNLKSGYIFGQLTWYNPKQLGFDHCGTYTLIIY
jgi:hypothetical protein